MTAVAHALLAILVLCAWLGCFGYARLTDALDRLHCLTFINATCGLALLLMSLAADGASQRTFKILLIAVGSLAGGAALVHAVGRALVVREEVRK